MPRSARRPWLRTLVIMMAGPYVFFVVLHLVASLVFGPKTPEERAQRERLRAEVQAAGSATHYDPNASVWEHQEPPLDVFPRASPAPVIADRINGRGWLFVLVALILSVGMVATALVLRNRRAAPGPEWWR